MNEKQPYNSEGYIPIPRSDVFWKLPPDELYVFRWFLHEAAYKTHQRQFRGQYQDTTITEEKGCKTVKRTVLENVFKCYSWKKIRLIIGKLIERNLLKKEGQFKGQFGRTIYHIVNYNTYILHGAVQKNSKGADSPVKKKDIYKRKKGKERSVFSENDLSLANLLSELMTKNNPSRKPTTEKELNSWGNECRLMREQDKRIPKEILEHIQFSQEDLFWKQNILSMGKLRKQYDRLTLKMKDNGDGNSGNFNTRSNSKKRESSYGDGKPYPVDLE